jgi:hypothetical protein
MENGAIMNWEQKCMAIQALTGFFGFALSIRKEGDWYVSYSGLERCEGSCLSSGCCNGKTPQEAVEACWKWATNPHYYMVVHAYDPNRRAVRWNGFMWEDVDEEAR